MDSIYQKLEKARAQLNQLIEDEAEYSIILKKSQEVDEILNELQKNERKKGSC
jgi:hypothetical protein